VTSDHVVPGEPLPSGQHHHPAQKIRTPEGRYAWIDTGMVALVRALWAAGYVTVTCCQDLGESAGELSPRAAACWKGYALLELPVTDACALATLAAAHDLTRHWAEPGAWEVSAPVIMLGSRAVLMNLVQVHFPAGQIHGLTRLVARYGRQFLEGQRRR